MKKSSILIIPLFCFIMTVIFPFPLLAKKASYWDYFREPDKRPASGYDINVGLNSAIPFMAMSDRTKFGLGLVFGFHYQIKFFRVGVQTEPTFFKGMDIEQETDFFLSVPLYLDIAFDIRCAPVFSLVPFLSVGPAFDFLSAKPARSVLDPPIDYEIKASIHLAEKLGLGFWFHVNKRDTVQVNIGYGAIIEFSENNQVAQMEVINVCYMRKI